MRAEWHDLPGAGSTVEILLFLLVSALACPVPAATQSPAGRPTASSPAERPADSSPGPGSAPVPRVDSVSVDPSAFLDSTALVVFAAARRWQMERDTTIRSYEAIRRQRFSVQLRTPLRDRTLYHAEAASRIWWSPEGVVEQYLASQETTPDGVEPPGELVNISEIFDPATSPYARNDGIAGEGREDVEREEDDIDVSVSVDAEDFLAPGSEEHFRYRTADSLVVILPDGRVLRTVALEVIPRERSGRLGSGVIWIEPESGALVRSVSRLSSAFDLEEEGVFDEVPRMRLIPGIFRPIQFDVSLIVVEYSLWDFRHWMRRRVRMEGAVRAGVVNLPGVLEETYQVLDVAGSEDDTGSGDSVAADAADPETALEVAERWRSGGQYGAYRVVDGEEASLGEGEPRSDEGPPRIVLAPVDSIRLHDPEWLPPPVWEEAPGFTSEESRRELTEMLGKLQLPPPPSRGIDFAWGYQGPGLLRYNRVEGLSVGARAEWKPPFSPAPDEVTATGRVGVGTWVPDGRLEVAWTGPDRTLALSGYHSVLPVDPTARSLGLGNSTSALLFGRDDGDYFRATGVSLALVPGERRRQWYDLYLSAEEHRPLPTETDFSVFGGPSSFRPALEAGGVREYRVGARLAPWWGRDPFGFQGGLELLLERGEGDRSWTRAGATGRVTAPLISDLRGGVEVAGGHLWGDPPIQRHWFLGGTRTLRGYAGAAAVGATYGRARADLSWGTPAGRVSIFGDAGWAGDSDLYHRDDILLSAGAGLSLLDGLLRIDLARALRSPTGWRLELHLDSFH